MMFGLLCQQTLMLRHIGDLIDPIALAGDSDVEINGIAYDSRQVKPGMLFVAVKGEQTDGNEFIDEAIERGAVAVVSERDKLERRDAVHIHVESARQALAEIACAFHGNPSRSMDTVGITGTNGKTTTAYMVRHILQADGRKPGLISTVSYEFGGRSLPASRTTPESLDLQSLLSQMRHVGCRSSVMEVSSHALAQKRVWGVDFDVGVFTNLTQDHLDYHDSMEQYFAAKALLFSGWGRMKRNLTAVINIDDEWGLRLAQTGGNWERMVSFGQSPEADVRAEYIKMEPGGVSFQAVAEGARMDIRLNLIGSFNVSNALAAIAVAHALNVDPQTIGAALANFESVPGRLEEVPNDRGLRVFVDYAHTHEALRNVLTTLREVTRKRLITVFGCGGDRDKDKRALMGAVAATLSDYSVITSDNPRKENPSDIITQIEAGYEGRDNYRIVEDRESAIAAALDMASEDDVVLIAGKGHEKYQQFADTIVPFDDLEVARSIMER